MLVSSKQVYQEKNELNVSLILGGGKVYPNANIPTLNQFNTWKSEKATRQVVLLFLGDEMTDRFRRSLEPLVVEGLRVINREWVTQSFINQSLMDFSGSDFTHL
jgi:hypothetical protein